MKTCSVNLCEVKHSAKGYCGRHYRENIQGRTYKSWEQMKARCYNPSSDSYEHYHSRGIRVCEQWLNSYANFLADMGKRPEGTTIDRIDNDGNYEPSNCRWATPKQQANNRSANRLFTINGVTRTMAEWCDFSGLKRSTFKTRLYVHKWPIERIVSTPAGKVGVNHA